MIDRKRTDELPVITKTYDPIEGKDGLGREVTPGFCIDISSVIDLKTDMLACHASQRDWSAERGRQAGVADAEGFRQHLGQSYPQDNQLEALLKNGANL